MTNDLTYPFHFMYQLLRLLTFLCPFLLLAACGKIELPDPDTGGGSTGNEQADTIHWEDYEEEAISVRQAIAAPEGTYVAVVGYIVGYMANNSPVFRVPAEGSNPNFLLADTPDETDKSRIIVISLGAKGSLFREQLNLYSHPEYLHRGILVEGMLEKYYHKNGIKEIFDYSWVENLPEPDKPEPGNPDDIPTPALDENPQTIIGGR